MDQFKRPLADPEICRGFSRRACVMSQIFASWYIQTKGSWLYTYIYIYLLNLIPTFFGVKTKNLSIFRRCIYIYTTYLWEVPKKPEPKNHAPRCLSSPRYVPAAACCGQRNILVEVAVRDGWRIIRWEFLKSVIENHWTSWKTSLKCWKHLKSF